LIPLKLSFRYYVGNQSINPYFTIGGAVSLLRRTFEEYIPDNTMKGYHTQKTYDNGRHPTVNMGIGALILLSDKLNWDFSLSRETGTIIGQFLVVQAGVQFQM